MPDFSWLSDPNVLQGMGRIGSSLSSGDPAGVALDPSDWIRQVQFQRAAQAGGLFGSSLGGQPLPPQSGTVNTDLLKSSLLGLQPTPVGQPGPNSINHKITPEGTTTTVMLPNQPTNTPYSAQIPLEAVSNTPKQMPVQGGAGYDPFLQALLAMGI